MLWRPWPPECCYLLSLAPAFLSVEVSNNALFAEIAKLEVELRRLQNLKEQQGLSPEEKDEIDRKMDVASAQLSKGLRLSQENRSRFAPCYKAPSPYSSSY